MNHLGSIWSRRRPLALPSPPAQPSRTSTFPTVAHCEQRRDGFRSAAARWDPDRPGVSRRRVGRSGTRHREQAARPPSAPAVRHYFLACKLFEYGGNLQAAAARPCWGNRMMLVHAETVPGPANAGKGRPALADGRRASKRERKMAVSTIWLALMKSAAEVYLACDPSELHRRAIIEMDVDDTLRPAHPPYRLPSPIQTKKSAAVYACACTLPSWMAISKLRAASPSVSRARSTSGDIGPTVLCCGFAQHSRSFGASLDLSALDGTDGFHVGPDLDDKNPVLMHPAFHQATAITRVLLSPGDDRPRR